MYQLKSKTKENDEAIRMQNKTQRSRNADAQFYPASILEAVRACSLNQ